jgi:hypothetical protein
VKACPVVKVNLDAFSTRQLNDVHLHAPTVVPPGNAILVRRLDRPQTRCGCDVVGNRINVTLKLSRLNNKNAKQFFRCSLKRKERLCVDLSLCPYQALNNCTRFLKFQYGTLSLNIVEPSLFQPHLSIMISSLHET